MPPASSAAKSTRPQWFDQILRIYSPTIEQCYPELLSPDMESAQVCREVERLKPYMKERWDLGKDKLWVSVRRIGLDEHAFAELVSRCWLDGCARVLAKQHGKDRLAS